LLLHSAIAEIFFEMLCPGDRDRLERVEFDSGDMDLEDRMNLWFGKDDVSQIQLVEGSSTTHLDDAPYPREIDTRSESTSQSSDQQPDPDQEIPVVSVYHDIIQSSEAYEWLFARLKRELYLTPTEPYITETIGQIISSLMPLTRRLSRALSSEAHRIRLKIDWDPNAFFAEQEYPRNPAEAAAEVITLTGSCQNAQALPCVHYLKQTWPTTGALIMDGIKKVIANGPGCQQKCKFPHFLFC
jgi:hypothetical protein